MFDYSEYLPYLNDSVDSLLNRFQESLLERVTIERIKEIREELKIYLNHFKNMKELNPDKVIDDHVGAILISYMVNPWLDIPDRDAHYNGCWYALWGDINKLPRKDVKAKCSNKNPNDKRWTEVCLVVVDEFYDSFGINHGGFINNLLKRIKKKS